MKKFKFRFPPFVWVLLLAGFIVCVLALCINVYNLTQYIHYDLFKFLPFIIYSAIALFLIFVVFSILFFSEYSFKNGYLYVHFGIFYSKTKLDKVVGVTHFKKSDKLVVFFNDQTFSVIVIAKEQYDAFVENLKELNKQIFFTHQLDDENFE